jgi:hypothetical protein
MPPTFRIEGVDCKVVFIYVQWRRNSRVVLTNYGRSAAPRPGMFARGRRQHRTRDDARERTSAVAGFIMVINTLKYGTLSICTGNTAELMVLIK